MAEHFLFFAAVVERKKRSRKAMSETKRLASNHAAAYAVRFGASWEKKSVQIAKAARPGTRELLTKTKNFQAALVGSVAASNSNIRMAALNG